MPTDTGDGRKTWRKHDTMMTYFYPNGTEKRAISDPDPTSAFPEQ